MDPKYRIKVRVVSARAYHSLFMRNMLIRPTEEELENYGTPDFTIYNAGAFPANRYTSGMTSTTSVAINFHMNEMVILGTEYAGEMKKGIFTVMHYYMPIKHNVYLCIRLQTRVLMAMFPFSLVYLVLARPLLSADPKRFLIGDDEHCWSEDSIFNIEGVNYDDAALTENTRCAYPIEYIPNAKIPCISSGHPKNIILLTCDAYGVLPPVSKLSSAQAMYHFISGYTAKIAGTEDGVTEPEATFSACFGQPFLVLHPYRYAKMLAEKMEQHSANAWLVNTGWNGGAYGIGERIKLKYSRAIIDAIHSGELAQAEYENYEIFNLQIPKTCSEVPSEILHPAKTWKGSQESYVSTRNLLAQRFIENFKLYQDQTTLEVVNAGPILS
ncbi:unnamed protein product [Rhizophagus irregularis]|nr:unnamed protein product [Rhizophagus irregularis]